MGICCPPGPCLWQHLLHAVCNSAFYTSSAEDLLLQLQQRNPKCATHGPCELCSASATGASLLILCPPPLTLITINSATSFWQH